MSDSQGHPQAAGRAHRSLAYALAAVVGMLWVLGGFLLSLNVHVVSPWRRFRTSRSTRTLRTRSSGWRGGDGQATFEVRDDGVGFEPEAVGYGTGLQGMTDRLDALGGSLTIQSAPGAGTRVQGRVPAGGARS